MPDILPLAIRTLFSIEMVLDFTTRTDTAFEIAPASNDGALVISCDHASNAIPPEVNGGSLGLPAKDMGRHIAFDVGAAGVSRHLGRILNAPVVLSRFSRLLVDPNRGEDDPTLFMKLYDGTIIPGNRDLTDEDKTWRLENCYRPYHRALGDLLDARQNPILIAIHSFTAQLDGHPPRPWHLGVLFGQGNALGPRLIERLGQDANICVGANEPYGGHLAGDSIDRHAIQQGRPNILIEIRNDLIRTEKDQLAWANKLAPAIMDVALSKISA